MHPATGVVQTDTNFVQTGNQMNAFSGPVQIGSTGSPVKALYQATTTISGSLTSGSNTSFTVSVNGVSATGDGLVVPRWSGALPAGVSVSQCYVSAANQVTVILHNNNGSTTTLPSTTLGVVEMEF